MNTVTTCDAYLRLSDLRTEEAFEGREANLRRYADSIGWTVRRIVVENDVVCRECPGKVTFADGKCPNCGGTDGKPKQASAWKKRKIKTPSGRVELRVIRPKFRAMLDDVASGQIDGMLFEDIDRALRDHRDGQDLLDAIAPSKELPHGASVRSISGSMRLTDGGTSDETFMFRTFLNVAAKASDDTSRRVKDARNRWHGKSYFGGLRPFGYVHVEDTPEYHKTLQIVDDEADVLRKLADDIINLGIPLKAEVRWLNDQHILTVTGKRWNSTKVKQALLKPTIAGLQVHEGEEKEGPWEAILEPEVWRKLKAILEDPERTTTTGNEPKWLLSKIATCGVCTDGHTVTVSGTKKDTGPAYQCDRNHVRRNVTLADAWVRRNITAYMSVNYMTMLKPEQKPDIDPAALQAEAKRLRAKSGELVRMFNDDEIDAAQLKSGSRDIRDRIRVIEAQLANTEKPDPVPEIRDPSTHAKAHQIWDSWSLERRRSILKQMVDIVILPTSRRGPGFDEDSVRITLKTGELLDVRTWPATA